MAALLDLGGERVLRCDPDGPTIDGDQRAVDLVGEALADRATLVVVPVGRLGPEFFNLRSGVAGAVVQKFVTYRLKLAIIGDITAHLAASDTLRDWVRECNRGGDVAFFPHFDDLAARLGVSTPPQ